MDLRWAITLFLKATMLWRRLLPLAYPNRPVCLQGDPAFTAVVFQDENPRLGDHTLGTIERWFKHQILSSFVETLRNATIHRPPTGPILRQSPHNPCLFLQRRTPFRFDLQCPRKYAWSYNRTYPIPQAFPLNS
jgi:hypothetical protein